MYRPQHAISVAQDKPMLTRRMFRIGSVVLFHVMVIGAVTQGLATLHVFEPEKVLEASIVQDKPLDTPPPVIPKPQTIQPPTTQYTVPAPDIVVEADIAPPISAVVGPPAPNAPISTATTVAGDTEAVALITSQPPYSVLGLKGRGESGTVTLRLHISDSGFVIAADLVESSGFSDLDKVAASWAVAHWKYKPAIQGGKAVATSSRLAKVTFQAH